MTSSDIETRPRRRAVNMIAATGGVILPDRVYSSAQAALILSRTDRTLNRWRRDGTGPRVTRQDPNSPPEYRGADLLAWLDQCADRREHIAS